MLRSYLQNQRGLTLLTIAVLIAYLPLMVVHFVWLWQYPHYQHIPLIFAAVVWLGWKRYKLERTEKRPADRLAFVLLIGSAAMLGAGILLFSPWLASVSLVFAVGGLAFAWMGRAAFACFGPVWLLLWFTIPLPLGWDQHLISSLQTITSRCSSDLLDMMDIPHLMAGNVLEFPGKRFLVEEACSGVHSFFALITVTAIYLVWRRQPWTVAVVMLPAAVASAVVMNVTRVTAIAVVYHSSGRDLSSGWRHELLGYGTFVLAMLLLAAAEQVALFFFRPIEGHEEIERSKVHAFVRAGQSICQWWNRIFAGMPAMVPAPEELSEDGTIPAPESMAEAEHTPAPRRTFQWLPSAGVFACLVLCQLTLLRPQQSAEFPTLETVARLDDSSLPETISGWEQVGFEHQERDRTSDEGEHSLTWDYRAQNYSPRISCDFPFIGWHELAVCYKGNGWTIASRTAVEAPILNGEPQAGFVSVELSKPSGESGILYFSLFDSAAEPILMPKSPGSLVMRWQDRLTVRTDDYGWQVPTCQIQAFASFPGEIPPEARDDLRRGYLTLRQVLLEKLNDAQR